MIFMVRLTFFLQADQKFIRFKKILIIVASDLRLKMDFYDWVRGRAAH